jgi:sugar phosphate isomerase/epimerase
MVDLALCWLTVPSARPVEVVHAAAAAGYVSVGLKVLDAGESDTAVVGATAGDVSALVNASRNEGVPILRTSGFRIDARYDAGRFDRFLEISAELGAKSVSVIATDAIRTRLNDSFANFCVAARQHGMETTLEFAPFSSVPTLTSAFEVVRESDEPTASVILDVLHFFRSGGAVSDLLTPAGSAVSLVQLCDGFAEAPPAESLLVEARTNRLDVGTGALPVSELLDALPSDISLEVEAPVWAERHLGAVERASNAHRNTRQFLAAVGRS